MRRVAVVGGGLAGITAALRLADAGCEVKLLESRPRLGGLTHSFARDGLAIDNGQHVFMRCCTSYRALLDRLGVTDATRLQRRLDVGVVRASDRRCAVLRRDALPAPLHLARSLASYQVLSLLERLRAVWAALALRRVDRNDPTTDLTSFGDWLVSRHQSPAAIEALWDLVGVATTNSAAADVSLAVAATVFQIGLLTTSDAADMGWATIPLQALHGDAAMRSLTSAGVDVRLRTRVRAIESGPAWRIGAGSEEIAADAVVVATDHVTAERLLPSSASPLLPGWSMRLGWAPIVNVHVIVDRTVLAEPFVAGIGTPVQWVFDRTAQAGLRSGQYLAVSLSAADRWLRLPVAELTETFVTELRRLLPVMRRATVLDVFVTREPHATFRAAPGSAAFRPEATTNAPGLFLAGAYTATGWPATMEGAVRSGETAAAAVLGAAHRDPARVAA